MIRLVFTLIALLSSQALQAEDNEPSEYSIYRVTGNSPEKLPTVPSTALVRRNGIPGVFIYQNGKARFVMVKTGKTDNKQIEILSGLLNNDQIVLGQLDKLHDGSSVSLQIQ